MTIIITILAYSIAAGYLWSYDHMNSLSEQFTFQSIQSGCLMSRAIDMAANDYSHAYLYVMWNKRMRNVLFLAFIHLFVVPSLFSDEVVIGWIIFSLVLLLTFVLIMKRKKVDPMNLGQHALPSQIEARKKLEAAYEKRLEDLRVSLGPKGEEMSRDQLNRRLGVMQEAKWKKEAVLKRKAAKEAEESAGAEK